jgi:hypothetical protein
VSGCVTGRTFGGESGGKEKEKLGGLLKKNFESNT